MYSIYIENRKIQKILDEYFQLRFNIEEKLDRLKLDPRRANGAHPLHGKLEGKWSCWIGSNIRLVYIIDDKEQKIIIQAIGTHKIY
jgi:addiction module RelE/StbE family toxin